MTSSPPEPATWLPPSLPHQSLLRESSPRLFRDFFDAMPDAASRQQATLPRPVPTLQDPLQNVNRALENANRALQDAQEAFHHARHFRTESEARLRTDSEAPGQLVDLTRTSSPPSATLNSPGAAESHYISHTTHPHDPSHTHRSRTFSSLHEPVYPPPGSLVYPLPGPQWATTDPSLPYPRANSRFVPRHRPIRLPRIHPLDDGHLQSAAEEDAITRQRQNHSNWERTQARNRDCHRHQDQDQDQSPPNTQSSPSTTTMSPPTSSSSRIRTKASQRRALGPEMQSDPSVDEVDLTAVDDPASLSAALSRQREEAILSQNPGTEEGRTPFTAYKCPVCMDTPTDATSTACGHVFCHRCIVDTLNWSIEQRREGAPANRKVKGVCPVCRKPLDLKDTPGTGRSLVPLEFKKLMPRKRKREQEPDSGKGKAKALVRAETLSDDEDDGNTRRNPGRGKKRERESTEDAIWRTFTNDAI